MWLHAAGNSEWPLSFINTDRVYEQRRTRWNIKAAAVAKGNNNRKSSVSGFKIPASNRGYMLMVNAAAGLFLIPINS